MRTMEGHGQLDSAEQSLALGVLRPFQPGLLSVGKMRAASSSV